MPLQVLTHWQSQTQSLFALALVQRVLQGRIQFSRQEAAFAMGLFAFRLVNVVDCSDAQLQTASFKPHLYLCMCLHLGAQMRAFICQHKILVHMLLVLSQFVFFLVDSFCMFLPYPWASAARTLDSMERCLRLVARCDPTSQNVAAIDV